MTDSLDERPKDRASKPAFFWLALAVGIGFFVLLVYESVNAFRYGTLTRDARWSASLVGGKWVVTARDPDGALHASDEVLAIDSDRRVARAGPRWKLQDREPGPYDVEVRRDDRTEVVRLRLSIRDDSTFLPWIFIYLGCSLSFFAVGTLMALARPESRMIRWGFASCLLTAALMLGEALHALGGIRHDFTVMALESAFPLFYVTGYLFFASFPEPVSASRRWKIVFRAVATLGIALWVPRTTLNLLRAMGPETAMEVLDRHFQLLHFYYAAIEPAEVLYAAGAALTIFAVLRRNYVLLPEGSGRRRIRFVVWSHALALAPVMLGGMAKGVGYLLAVGGETAAALDLTAKLANGFTILAPIGLGYAVLKHRILGFGVVLRMGLQYMLARNVLRAVLLLPLAWFGLTIATNPNRTLGELLFTGWSRLNLVVLTAAALGLRYRAQLSTAIDKRFFREAYDQQQILLSLIEAIQKSDSLAEIAEMAAAKIDAALHTPRVTVLYRSPEGKGFSVEYSSENEARALHLEESSPMLRDLRQDSAARTAKELAAISTPDESAWLDRLGVDLVIPIQGVERNSLVGLLMVGEKRSEEPFTSKDKSLLQLLAAQIGGVYEVLTLRGEIGRHRRIQQEVLARFDRERLNLVKECRACGACYDSSAERCDKDGQELAIEVPVERVVEGKYRLERVIGRGGMGAVYEATDLRLNRRVALKVMTGHLIGSGTALRRFAREAQASARLEHPNIVRVYDYGPLGNDSAYLVMEHVQGVTWSDEIGRLGAFPLPLAADALDQVLDGVEAAHAAGILHRDLKPSNLMLRRPKEEGPVQVKILDFGLAKVRELAFADPKSLTAQGVTLGTFGYMAPEQLLGEEVDERADVYSLGVIALETLTGRLRIAQQFFHQTIESELVERLVVPARTAPQRALADALKGCLAAARDVRIASAREMRRVLIPAIRSCEDLPLPPPPGELAWTKDSTSRPRFPSLPSDQPTQNRGVSRREKE